MMDPYVLLTPIFLLAVLALVRFVGCFTEPAPPAPMLLSAVAGDQMVVLTWNLDQFHLYKGYNIKRGSAHGGPYKTIGTADDNATSFADTGLANDTEVFYVVSGRLNGGGIFGDPTETSNSNELSATPEPNITVTFDSPTPTPNPGAFSGAYKNLNFPPGQWNWVDPFTGGGPANAVTFPLANSPGGDIMFVNGPRVLLSIRVFPKQASTLTISDNSLANPQVAVTFQAADANNVHVIPTNWTLPTQSFHIGTDIGYDLLIDTIVYLGPA